MPDHPPTGEGLPPHLDRRTFLIVGGIYQLLLGLMATGLSLLTVVGWLMASRIGTPHSPTGIVTGVLIYGLAAAFFVTNGIGSIRMRRWARALSLVAGWVGIVFGVMATVMMALIMPTLLGKGGGVFVGCMLVIAFIFYIGIPLILVFIYRGPNVRLTVEALDQPRWTDRAPLPVLAAVLVLAFTAVTMLTSLAYATIPFVDWVITGFPAVLICLALSFIFGMLALQLYRLRPWALYTLIALQTAGAVVSMLTVMRADFVRVFESMDPVSAQYSPEKLSVVLRQPPTLAVLALVWVAFIGYLIWLRRYFVAPRS